MELVLVLRFWVCFPLDLAGCRRLGCGYFALGVWVLGCAGCFGVFAVGVDFVWFSWLVCACVGLV